MSASITVQGGSSRSVVPAALIAALLWAAVIWHSALEGIVYTNLSHAIGKSGQDLFRSCVLMWPDLSAVLLMLAVGMSLVLASELVSRLMPNAPEYATTPLFLIGIVVICVPIVQAVRNIAGIALLYWQPGNPTDIAVTYSILTVAIVVLAIRNLLKYETAGPWGIAALLCITAVAGTLAYPYGIVLEAVVVLLVLIRLLPLFLHFTFAILGLMR